MIKMLHSAWAYIVLILLIVTVGNALLGLLNKRKYGEKDLRIPLFTLIVAHIQLIIGLITYFASVHFTYLKENGMGSAMKESGVRYFIMEHPLMMILAIVLITMGFSIHKKKTTDANKYKAIIIYYGIALLFVLSRIPWNQWLSY